MYKAETFEKNNYCWVPHVMFTFPRNTRLFSSIYFKFVARSYISHQVELFSVSKQNVLKRNLLRGYHSMKLASAHISCQIYLGYFNRLSFGLRVKHKKKKEA